MSTAPSRWAALVLAVTASAALAEPVPRTFSHHMPSWSPDGERIVFYSDRDGNFEIYTLGRDGSGLRRLTEHPASDQLPSWSPTGSEIVFNSDRTGGGDLYVIGLDGSGRRRLTSIPDVSENFPSWSPDGSTVLFHTYDARSRQAVIHRVAADGRSEPVALTDPAVGFSDYASWSRQEDLILFESNRFGPFETFTMSPDGSAQTRVAAGLRASPRWSRDGRRIFFHSNEAGDWNIYSMAADGGDVRQHTTDPGRDALTHPSPVRDEIVFESDRSGYRELYRLALGEGAAPVCLTRQPEHEITGLIRSRGLGLARARDRDLRSGDPEGLYFSPEAMSRLGFETLEQGDPETARRIFLWLLETYPGSGEGHRGLAAAYQALAESELRRGLVAQPDNLALVDAIGLPTAIERLEQRGAEQVDEAAVNRLGYRLLGQSRTADAVAVFELAVRLFPDRPNVFDSLGEALAVAGQTDRAIASYQRVLTLRPGDPNATRRLEQLRSQ